jgi:hypothetical protein
VFVSVGLVVAVGALVLATTLSEGAERRWFETRNRVAFDELVQRVLSKENGIVIVNGRVGEYPVLHAQRFLDGVFVMLGPVGTPWTNGLVWLPGPMERQRLPWLEDCELLVTPIEDGWYRYRIGHVPK